MSFFFQNKKKNYLKLFLIVGLLVCWTSISFNPEKLVNIEHFFKNNFTLFELVNLLRGSITLFFFPVIFIIFVNFLKKEHLNKLNLVYFLFLSLFLIQFIAIFLSPNQNFFSYYLFNSFNVIFILILSKSVLSDKEFTFLTTLSFTLLILMFVYFGTLYLIGFFISSGNFYGSWNLISRNEYFDVPRPTGLARTCLIIFIFSTIYSTFNRNYNNFFIFLSILSVTFIYLLSSRTILFIYILYLLFYIFNYCKNINQIFKVFFRYILIPSILIICLVFSKQVFKERIEDKIFSENGSRFNIFQSLRTFPDLKKKEKIDFSTGRIDDWKKIYIENKKTLYGNGAMGDRYLIKQTASNAIFYTYASSGYLGVFIFIIISLISFYFAALTIIKDRNRYDNPNKLASALVIIFLLLRSLLETSYAIFSIDFIIFSLCFANITYMDTHKK